MNEYSLAKDQLYMYNNTFRKTRNTLFVISLVTMSYLFFSCASREIDTEALVLNVEFNMSKNTPFRVSQMIDTVSFIQLDDSCLIGFIDELKVFDKNLFACDKHAGVIYCFSMEGKLIRKIDCKGRARNEYVSISNMDVSQTTGEIIILDAMTNRFVVFSKDGDYLRDIKCEDVVRDFTVMSNGDYLMYTPDYIENARRGLWLCDSLGRYKKHLVSISDDFKSGGIYPDYLIHIGRDSVGLMGGEDKDNIYLVHGDSVKTQYHIDYGFSIPSQLASDPLSDYEKHQGKVYTKYSYFENRKWLMFSSSNMESTITTIYDKINKKQYDISRQEDIINDKKLYGHMMYLNNELMICMMLPDSQDKEAIRRMMPNFKSNTNPILAIYTIK